MQTKWVRTHRYSRPLKLTRFGISLVLDPSVNPPLLGYLASFRDMPTLEDRGKHCVCVCVQETWFPFLSLSSSYVTKGLSA